MRQTPDYYMWIKLVQKHNIHIIEEPLVNFLEHSSAISENVSAPGFKNDMRCMVEVSHIFCSEMKNMDDEFFKRSFKLAMRNPNASTYEEIMCEKYFVLHKSRLCGVQSAATAFYYDVFTDISLYRVLKDVYGYSNKDFNKTNMDTGLMTIVTTLNDGLQNAKRYVNNVALKLQSDEYARVERKNQLREELQVLETYSIFCDKLLGEKTQISDENWNEFSEVSAAVAEMVNQRMTENSFETTYNEIMSDENRQAERNVSISKCKQVCDDYIRAYRIVNHLTEADV
jgi:hypothetical protein